MTNDPAELDDVIVTLSSGSGSAGGIILSGKNDLSTWNFLRRKSQPYHDYLYSYNETID